MMTGCCLPCRLFERGTAVGPERGSKGLPKLVAERSSLLDVTEHVDVVQVFRPASDAASIAPNPATIGAAALWLHRPPVDPRRDRSPSRPASATSKPSVLAPPSRPYASRGRIGRR